MKKVYIVMVVLSAIFLVSCNNNDNGGGEISPVTDVAATPFIGAVKLSWSVPNDSSYYYTLITYKDSEGNTVHKKVGCYDAVDGLTKTTIGGFSDTDAHDFVLTAHSLSGATSSEVKVTGTPQDVSGAKDYVMETVEVDPAEEAASVHWTNESNVDVKLIITYTDMKNVNICDTVDAQKSDSVTCSGLQKTTNIAIVAYNVKDEAKSVSKTFSVTPIVDPDDVIYDNIEYFTLGTRTNLINVSQDNSYNPYEYTIVTLGTDPYMWMTPLVSPKAGTVLKFRYKASRDFVFELFYCNAGSGPKGGHSTKVTVPAASTWTTYTYDYGSEMLRCGWSGNVGDFFRMDWGNVSGVTIQIRNIHLE